MLHIGKGYLSCAGGMTRLCADVTIGDRRTTMWFGVDSDQEEYLTLGRADPFVMALLPSAMRGGHGIVCEDLMSERLHYQLCRHLLPALAFAGGPYRAISITAPLTAVPYRNQGAVGTGFSGGVDCLYTIMNHGPDSDLPLTHLAMFDTGGLLPEHGPEKRARFYNQAKRFAEERGLKTVSVCTNLEETLSNAEVRAKVYSFRDLARTLSLQGLFSVYLRSSGFDISNFAFNFQNPTYFEPLLVPCASTESTAFYLSGLPLKRYDKLKSLLDWEPSWRWLHSCQQGAPGEVNCGHCKKCVRDMAALYALDRLERYRAVYDVEDFKKHLAVRLGSALAKSDICIYDEQAELLKKSGRPIPSAAWAYARQLERAMESLRVQEEKKGIGSLPVSL